MSSKSKYKPVSRKCIYCKKRFWAHTKRRLDAWMLHHTSELCEAAAKMAGSIHAKALAQAKLITEEQLEKLEKGILTKV